jgi:hypothetical protein
VSVLRVLAYLGALPVVSAVLHLLGLTVALSLALGVPLTIAGVLLLEGYMEDRRSAG